MKITYQILFDVIVGNEEIQKRHLWIDMNHQFLPPIGSEIYFPHPGGVDFESYATVNSSPTIVGDLIFLNADFECEIDDADFCGLLRCGFRSDFRELDRAFSALVVDIKDKEAAPQDAA